MPNIQIVRLFEYFDVLTVAEEESESAVFRFRSDFRDDHFVLSFKVISDLVVVCKAVLFLVLVKLGFDQLQAVKEVARQELSMSTTLETVRAQMHD